MDVWEAFATYIQVVCTTAKANVRDEAQLAFIHNTLTPLLTAPKEEWVNVLRCFFANVPAHWAAVNSLDHTQFVNPLVFGPHTVNLCAIMECFSKLGPVAHGQVWLPLVHLAHLIAPNQINQTACNEFIQSQMKQCSVVPTDKPVLPIAPAQLEAVMSNIMVVSVSRSPTRVRM